MTASAMLSLYGITDELVRVGEVLIENGGELTPELEAELATLGGAFEEKVERMLLFVLELQASAAAAMLEADRLRTLADQRAKAAARLKDYVKTEMQRAGRDKVATDRLIARIQANSRPSISWGRAIEDLPHSFARIVVTLDGAKAYEAWKSGESLPEGFVVERGSHLRVS